MDILKNIIQWNCNGCKTNYCELKSIMVAKLLTVICIQETHFKRGENFSLRGYNSFRNDVEPNMRARGGVAIFIKDNIPTTNINLRSPSRCCKNLISH